MTPILVEIIMPTLTTLEFGCSRCGLVFRQLDLEKHYRNSCQDEYPEEWRHEAMAIESELKRLTGLYKHRTRFRLIDAQSPLGLWKQIRHRISRLPAFIVDRRHVCDGNDKNQLESLIDLRIQEASRQMSIHTNGTRA